MRVFRTHDPSLEEFKTKAELDSIKYYQQLYLSTNAKRKAAPLKTDLEVPITIDNFEYMPIDLPTIDPDTNRPRKFEPIYGNYTNQINARL